MLVITMWRGVVRTTGILAEFEEFILPVEAKGSFGSMVSSKGVDTLMEVVVVVLHNGDNKPKQWFQLMPGSEC